jgi:hypothetical protein
VTKDPDAYAIWGDWDLTEFKVEVPRWRDKSEPRPPTEVVTAVNRWWPSLKQRIDRSGAFRVAIDDNPDGNLWWIFVPDVSWTADDAVTYKVLCRFWLFEHENPPRVTCKEFLTVPWMTPTEADQADGMGTG